MTYKEPKKPETMSQEVFEWLLISESLDDSERGYYCSIWNTMSSVQQESFTNICKEEKEDIEKAKKRCNKEYKQAYNNLTK